MKFLIGFVVLLYFAPSANASFFDEHAKGWFWYQDFDEKELKIEALPPKVKPNPSEQMKAYREKIEDSLNLAILNPTEDNLKAYARNYFEVINRSQQFTDAYQVMLLKNPIFDYSLQFPINPLAQRVYADQKEQSLEHALRAFAKTHGFFFFFDGACQYCHLFAPIVKSFAQKYGIAVLSIRLSEQGLNEFPDAVLDNGAAQVFNVSHLPALFAVNPNTKAVIPLAHGAISLTQLEENVFKILDYPRRYPSINQASLEYLHD